LSGVFFVTVEILFFPPLPFLWPSHYPPGVMGGRPDSWRARWEGCFHVEWESRPPIGFWRDFPPYKRIRPYPFFWTRVLTPDLAVLIILFRMGLLSPFFESVWFFFFFSSESGRFFSFALGFPKGISNRAAIWKGFFFSDSLISCGPDRPFTGTPGHRNASLFPPFFQEGSLLYLLLKRPNGFFPLIRTGDGALFPAFLPFLFLWPESQHIHFRPCFVCELKGFSAAI